MDRKETSQIFGGRSAGEWCCGVTIERAILERERGNHQYQSPVHPVPNDKLRAISPEEHPDNIVHNLDKGSGDHKINIAIDDRPSSIWMRPVSGNGAKVDKGFVRHSETTLSYLG